MAAALTREQKLLAEIVVQLGNITEAIRAAAGGDDSSSLITELAELKQQLTTLQTERTTLLEELAQSSSQIATLQTKLNEVTGGDPTPDTVTEVMSHLGIDYT